MQNHVNVIHLGKEFKCDGCNKKFGSQEAMESHIKNIHEGIRYECIECGKDYSTKHILKIHYEGVHMGVRYHCPDPECSYKDQDPTNLKKHRMRWHTGLKETKRKGKYKIKHSKSVNVKTE